MRFRKKPVEVDAEQWYPGRQVEGVKYPVAAVGFPGVSPFDDSATLDNQDGHFLVRPGDWIVTGEGGAKVVVSPEAFAASYEPVEPAEPPTCARCGQASAPRVLLKIRVQPDKVDHLVCAGCRWLMLQQTERDAFFDPTRQHYEVVKEAVAP